MGKTTFLFPGQGSQFVGMGKDLYDAHAGVRELYDRAEAILEFPLKTYCFEGPEEELRQTRYTQPAIFVHSIAVDGLLRERGIVPASTAGHSLGEYSALVSAGALAFADGLRLVKLRGELMQVSGEKNPGTMAALLGLEAEAVEKACAEASRTGIVQPANFNSPGQIVISGSIPAVHKAMELAKSAGARLVKELVVSGAFHSPLMGDALEGLISALRTVALRSPEIPVYSNVEAAPVREPQRIRELLQKQLLSPVRWEETLIRLIADQHDTFYEVGPGKVLQGLLKRTNRDYAAVSAGTSADIEALPG